MRYAREQQGPVLRHLPRHAVRGHRVRAQRGRARAARTRREFDPETPHPVIDLLPEQRGDRRQGRAPCGSATYPCALQPGTQAPRAPTGRTRDRRAPPPPLRVQQRLPRAARGARASCSRARRPTARLVEMIELPDHPWFVGCQFHPEFKSTPVRARTRSSSPSSGRRQVRGDRGSARRRRLAARGGAERRLAASGALRVSPRFRRLASSSGALAQLVERRAHTAEVTGSSPVRPTSLVQTGWPGSSAWIEHQPPKLGVARSNRARVTIVIHCTLAHFALGPRRRSACAFSIFVRVKSFGFSAPPSTPIRRRYTRRIPRFRLVLSREFAQDLARHADPGHSHDRAASSLLALFRSRKEQAIVELALRQQLAVYAQKRPRPKLSPLDRAFWVALSRLWPRWKNYLVVVQPRDSAMAPQRAFAGIGDRSRHPDLDDLRSRKKRKPSSCGWRPRTAGERGRSRLS